MRRGASGVSKGRSRVGTAGKQEQEEGLGKRQEAGQQNRVQSLLCCLWESMRRAKAVAE